MTEAFASAPYIAAVWLASGRLPDLGEPSTVAFGAAVGGLIGGSVARFGGLPYDDVSRLTANGVFTGGGAAFICWALLVITP